MLDVEDKETMVVLLCGLKANTVASRPFECTESGSVIDSDVLVSILLLYKLLIPRGGFRDITAWSVESRAKK